MPKIFLKEDGAEKSRQHKEQRTNTQRWDTKRKKVDINDFQLLYVLYDSNVNLILLRKGSKL